LIKCLSRWTSRIKNMLSICLLSREPGSNGAKTKLSMVNESPTIMRDLLMEVNMIS
jgi:hypothetical protein